MSTLVRVSSERPQEAMTQFHKARLQDRLTLLSTGVNITGNVCSETSPEEEAHV